MVCFKGISKSLYSTDASCEIFPQTFYICITETYQFSNSLTQINVWAKPFYAITYLQILWQITCSALLSLAIWGGYIVTYGDHKQSFRLHQITKNAILLNKLSMHRTSFLLFANRLSTALLVTRTLQIFYDEFLNRTGFGMRQVRRISAEAVIRIAKTRFPLRIKWVFRHFFSHAFVWGDWDRRRWTFPFFLVNNFVVLVPLTQTRLANVWKRHAFRAWGHLNGHSSIK